MAKDIFEEFDEQSDSEELNYEMLGSGLLMNEYDRITHEIRKNQKLEEIFEIIKDVKDSIIEKRKTELKESNDEAAKAFRENVEALYEMQVDFENSTGKPMENVNYLEYVIGGVGIREKDLDLINAKQEDYEICLQETKRMKKEVKRIGKELRKIRLQINVSLRKRYYLNNEEYQLDCLHTEKIEKLADNEEFLKKYSLIKSLKPAEYETLVEIFKKSTIVGRALQTLKNNGKERKVLSGNEDQNELVKAAFERAIADGTISSEDYAELGRFIEETKKRVSDKNYDANEFEIDDSEIGNMIYNFVRDFDSAKSKTVEEALREIREANDSKEANEETLSYEKIEDKSEFEAVLQSKIEEVTAATPVEEPKRHIEDNMIISFVLENEKFKNTVEIIRSAQRDIIAENRIGINRKIDEAYKVETNATRFIEREKTELTRILGIDVREEDGVCYIGDLPIVDSDIEILKLDDDNFRGHYKAQLERLEGIGKAERAVNRDIKKLEKASRHSYKAEIDLNQVANERNQILADKEETERDVEAMRFLARLPEEQLNRVGSFIRAIETAEKSEQQAKDLTTQLIDLDGDEKRKEIMGKAIVECVNEGLIDRQDIIDINIFIKKLQAEIEEGKYTADDMEKYEKNESENGLIVYDYIGLMRDNLERAKEISKRRKEHDDDDMEL